LKIAIDTNVILDAFASREPWNVDAEKIILLSSQENLEAVICASSITDIYYICNKIIHDNEKTRQLIKTLFTIFTIADIKRKDLQDALNSDMDDFEDAVISACAKRNNCKYIVTRDIKDFKNSQITAISPQDFLAKIE